MNTADLLFKKFIEEYKVVNGEPSLKEHLMLEQAFMNGIIAVTAAITAPVAEDMKIRAIAAIRRHAEQVANERMVEARGGNPDAN